MDTRKERLREMIRLAALGIGTMLAAMVVMPLIMEGNLRGFSKWVLYQSGSHHLLVGILAIAGISVALGMSSDTVAVKQKEKEIEEVQKEIAERDLSTLELLDRAIRLAINREEATMLRAERRVDMLFRIGLLFLVASVVAPLLSASLYWNLDPLPTTTVQSLKDLRTTLGTLPENTTVQVQRDWRILLGGISFGFLFLASAAGLMKQQGRQTDIYFRIGERVKFFERLASVVTLNAAAERNRTDGYDRELVTLVTEKLLLLENAAAKENSGGDAKDGQPPSSTGSEILRLFNILR